VNEGPTGASLPALLERERELEALAGHVLDEGVGMARDSEVTVLSARGSRLERDFSFGVILQLLTRGALRGRPGWRPGT
jgi:hypothetical protein